MPDAVSFDELIRRVRAGDQEAAAEVVRRYEPAIRRAVRFRLTDTRLGRVLDSMDVCQSVLASFFIRAAAGQYDLERPEQLLSLLAAMARKKLAFQVRKERAQRRDNRRVAATGTDEEVFVAGDPSPSRHVAARELLEEVRRRLSPDERQLAELRAAGLEWTAIAEQVGGSPEALRKKLARAVDRAARALGLDDGDPD
jgi:RNA polymerase sigma-70 factor (ECF subfamily)